MAGEPSFIIFTLAIDFFIFWLFQQFPSKTSTSASPREPLVSRSCRPQNAYYANKYWFVSYLIQPELQSLSVIRDKYKYVAFSQSVTVLVDIQKDTLHVVGCEVELKHS